MSKHLVLVAAGMLLLLAAINSTAMAVAFPVITSSLNASLVLAGWVLSIYQLVATVAMPMAGKASDVFGRRVTLIACLALFTAGSLLCAVAPSIELLILARAIQGVGGGGFLPTLVGIAVDEFPKARQRVIGLFSSFFPMGQIIGPNLGGWMIQSFGWRSVFWFNVPFGLGGLIAAVVLIPAGRKEEGHMDIKGAVLFAGFLFAFMIGLSALGDSSGRLPWITPWLLFAAGGLMLHAFLRRENTAMDPIIDPVLLRARPFLAANIYNFVFGAGAVGVLSFVPLYAVSIYGMSVLKSGLILTPRSVGMMVASTVTSVFLMRWGYRRPIIAGTGAIVLSLVLLGMGSSAMNILAIQLNSTLLLSAVMLLSGLGMGVVAPAANNACIDLMPQRTATITGVRGMFRQSGGALSIAITTLVLHNVGDTAWGFQLVFMGLAGVLLLSLPLVFAMPGGPQAVPVGEDGDAPGHQAR
ncbi:MAG: MFS transporter [Chloroflexota bacterium]